MTLNRQTGQRSSNQRGQTSCPPYYDYILRDVMTDNVEHLSPEHVKAIRADQKKIVQADLRDSRPRLLSLEAALANWAGGKPAGIKGLHIEGPPLAETVLEERR